MEPQKTAKVQKQFWEKGRKLEVSHSLTSAYILYKATVSKQYGTDTKKDTEINGTE